MRRRVDVSGSGRDGPPPAPDPLPIAVVDNHTHLDLSRDGNDAPDIQAVIEAATAVGVPRMVQIGCDLPGARFTLEVIDRYAALLGGVALHPNEAPRLADRGELDSARSEIELFASHPRVRVIGETGLDYFRTAPEGVQAQQDSFRWHIDLAKRTGKVLQVLANRRPFPECLQTQSPERGERLMATGEHATDAASKGSEGSPNDATSYL